MRCDPILVGLAWTCTVAAAHAQPALTTPDFAIDLYDGAANGSLQIVGMGGTSAATSGGSAAAQSNPAAAAVRPTTARSRWGWDFHLDVLTGDASRDFDGDGVRDGDGGLSLASGGLVIQRGRWAAGVSVMVLTAGLWEAGAERLSADTNVGRLVIAREVGGGEFVVGGSLDTAAVTVDDADTELFSITAAALTTGGLWRPAHGDLRVGAALALPLGDSEPGTDGCDPANCRGYVLPDRVAVPWRARVGAAVRLGPARWNQHLPATFRDERSALLAADLVITGAADDAIGLGAFGRQEALRSGQTISVSPRLGAELEPLPGRLRLRAGSYWEPGRAEHADGRIHGTLGVEVRFLEFALWGPRRLRATLTGDVARGFRNVGFSVGFWS